MRHAVLGVAALAFLLSLAPEGAFAHGGAYRGPTGEVPPGWRNPRDPPPPGPPPPLPPVPDAPPEHPDKPDAPSRPKPPVKGPDEGTPGDTPRHRGNVMAFENWVFWWAYNKDELLLRRTGPFERPLSDANREKIVAALGKTIGNRKLHPDIRAGAVIALARIEPDARHLSTLFQLATRATGEEKLVREAALLALGLTGNRHPNVRDVLLRIVEDEEDDDRGRCFAMVALGLVQNNSPEVLKALEERVAATEKEPDLAVCALLAIGLIGDEKCVPMLVEWLESGRIGEKKLKDIERSWIVGALGKIGHTDALETLRKALRAKARLTKRSAAIATGQVLRLTTRETRTKGAKLLARYCKTEPDLPAKNFAMISLGRLASDSRTPSTTRKLVVDFLEKAFRDSYRLTERPFVALAMGLAGSDTDPMDKKSPALRDRLAKILRSDLSARKGDETALGAQAIALGMLRDPASVDLLLKIFGDRGADRNFRQAAATGLGLIGGTKANEAILQSLGSREDRNLRLDTALAAGLFASPKAGGKLLKVFDDRKSSQFVLGSTALALGWIGDDAAIDPLIRILEPDKVNGKYPDLTRALAAVALGRLADQRPHRMLHRLSEDLNYRAMVPALDEILTIL